MCEAVRPTHISSNQLPGDSLELHKDIWFRKLLISSGDIVLSYFTSSQFSHDSVSPVQTLPLSNVEQKYLSKKTTFFFIHFFCQLKLQTLVSVSMFGFLDCF